MKNHHQVRARLLWNVPAERLPERVLDILSALHWGELSGPDDSEIASWNTPTNSRGFASRHPKPAPGLMSARRVAID